MIEIGIDEAGRGCVVGPMIMYAVALVDKQAEPFLQSAGVRDSKQLTRKRRSELAENIKKRCIYCHMEAPPAAVDNAVRENNLNVLERVMAVQELRGTLTQLENILQYSTGYAIIATDEELRVVRSNPLAEQYTGLTQPEISGSLLTEIGMFAELFHGLGYGRPRAGGLTDVPYWKSYAASQPPTRSRLLGGANRHRDHSVVLHSVSTTSCAKSICELPPVTSYLRLETRCSNSRLPRGCNVAARGGRDCVQPWYPHNGVPRRRRLLSTESTMQVTNLPASSLFTMTRRSSQTA